MKNKLIPFLAAMMFLTACNNEEDNSVTPPASAPIVKQASSYQVTIEEDIIYAQGLSHEDLNSTNATPIPLKMDAYVPNNDSDNRPLLMLIHGGGFTGGTKLQEPLVNIARYFAERGFVAFSIDYRLRGDKGSVPQEWIDAAPDVEPDQLGQFYAMYPAHRDAKAALRWIVANAATYNINTDYITVGGGSAGATTSIGISISELHDYRDEISVDVDNTLSTTNLSQSYEVKTILDFWGSSNSVDALNMIYGVQRFNANNPSLFIAHGTEDPTVLFSEAENLRSIYQANQVPYIFYELTGAGHGAWNATVDGKRLEVLAFDYVLDQQGLVIE